MSNTSFSRTGSLDKTELRQMIPTPLAVSVTNDCATPAAW